MVRGTADEHVRRKGPGRHRRWQEQEEEAVSRSQPASQSAQDRTRRSTSQLVSLNSNTSSSSSSSSSSRGDATRRATSRPGSDSTLAAALSRPRGCAVSGAAARRASAPAVEASRGPTPWHWRSLRLVATTASPCPKRDGEGCSSHSRPPRLGSAARAPAAAREGCNAAGCAPAALGRSGALVGYGMSRCQQRQISKKALVIDCQRGRGPSDCARAARG